MTRTILFLGATGYIGSTVLDRLRAADPAAKITVYGRNPEVLKGFESISPNLGGAVGSLDDLDKLEDLASKHDVTVNCAHADHIEAVRAVLKGQKRRFEATETAPVLIHTSGTGALVDDNAGTSPTEKIFTDWEADPGSPKVGKVPNSPQDNKVPLFPISSLPASAPHRNVDLMIVRADAAGFVHAYIVLPSTIYGISKTVFADRGLANPQSQQVPLLIRMSIDRGAAAMVGKGANVWPNVHIRDCADLFVLVYRNAVKGNGGDHGTRGYYFGENGEHTLLQVAEQIGAALKAKGLAQSAEPKTLSPAELDKYMSGSTYLGTNSRAQAVHSRKIGWNPTHTTDDFLQSITEDVDWTIANDRAKGADGKFVWGAYPKLVNGVWTM